MVVRHVVEEEAACITKEVAIQSGNCAAGVRPCRATVMRESRVGMMQECDHGDPVVDEQPGDAVVLDDVGNAPRPGTVL